MIPKNDGLPNAFRHSRNVEFIRRSILPNLLFCILFLFAGCGRTWIDEQDGSDRSVMTGYFYVWNGFVKGITVKNLSTGKSYSNSFYGWGKEFFPQNKILMFGAVGNLEPGTYAVTSLLAYGGITAELPVPEDVIKFEVGRSQIVYVGDIIVGFLKQGITEQDAAEKFRGQAPVVKIFPSRHPGFNSSLAVLMWKEPPTEGYREGERYFLDYFISRKDSIPRWARIAEDRRIQLEVLKKKGQPGS